MEFKIENTEVYGIKKSIIASGNAMRTTMDNNMMYFDDSDEKHIKHLKRASKLGSTNVGEGHDNYLNGIVVQFDLYAPLYMWKQLQRYHFLDFISSQSTMHRLTKFNIREQCVKDVDSFILERYQALLTMYDYMCKKDYGEIDEEQQRTLKERKDKFWRTLVASLPCGFVLGATMTTNYRQLKTIYLQRKNHKLKEWHQFCEWCEGLPHFKELCLGE